MITMDVTEPLERGASEVLARMDRQLSLYLRRAVERWQDVDEERMQRTRFRFAELMGLDPGVLSGLVTGRRKWDRAHIGKVAAGLGLSADGLLREASYADESESEET